MTHDSLPPKHKPGCRAGGRRVPACTCTHADRNHPRSSPISTGVLIRPMLPSLCLGDLPPGPPSWLVPSCCWGSYRKSRGSSVSTLSWHAAGSVCTSLDRILLIAFLPKPCNIAIQLQNQRAQQGSPPLRGGGGEHRHHPEHLESHRLGSNTNCGGNGPFPLPLFLPQ